MHANTTATTNTITTTIATTTDNIFIATNTRAEDI